MAAASTPTLSLSFRSHPQLQSAQGLDLIDQTYDGPDKGYYGFFSGILIQFAKEYFMEVIQNQPREQAEATFCVNHVPNAITILESSADGGMFEKIFVKFVHRHPQIRTLIERNILASKIQFSLKLRIREMVLSQNPALQATTWVRFPQMLVDLYRNHQDARKVCIAGPGSLKDPEDRVVSPIVIETLGAIPSLSRLTILDRAKRCLDQIDQGCEKGMEYDTTTLRHYASMEVDGTFGATFAAVRRMGNVESSMVQTESLGDRVECKPFDFTKDSFGDADKYDLIIGTYSISHGFHQMLERKETGNYYAYLLKFLKALNPNGALYVDYNVIKGFRIIYGNDIDADGFKYLELALKNKIKVERLPLSSVLPEITSEEGMVPKLASKREPSRFTSSTVYKLTRLQESPEFEEAERQRIIRRIVEVVAKSKDFIERATFLV